MFVAAQELMGIGTVLLLLAGALGCACYVKRTRWAAAFTVAFVVHGAGIGLARVVIFMVRHGHARLGLVLNVAQLLAVVGTAMIVATAVGAVACLGRRQAP